MISNKKKPDKKSLTKKVSLFLSGFFCQAFFVRFQVFVRNLSNQLFYKIFSFLITKGI